MTRLALAPAERDNVVRLKTAAPHSVFQQRTKAARANRLALVKSQSVKFGRAYPSITLNNKRLAFMGDSDSPRWATKVWAVTALDSMHPTRVAVVRGAVEGGDRNQLNDIELDCALHIRRLFPEEQAHLWLLYPRGGNEAQAQAWGFDTAFHDAMAAKDAYDAVRFDGALNGSIRRSAYERYLAALETLCAVPATTKAQLAKKKRAIGLHWLKATSEERFDRYRQSVAADAARIGGEA